jgi:proteic killer suppression protein
VLSLALSAAMLGIDGYVVRVEADSSPGTPAFAIIGLPDRALGESRERSAAVTTTILGLLSPTRSVDSSDLSCPRLFDSDNVIRYNGSVKLFSNKGTADIFDGRSSNDARRVLPEALHRRARILLTVLTNATDVNELRVPPSNRLEKLSGNREGQCSIRVNDRYRICFNWMEGAHEIEIVDYH